MARVTVEDCLDNVDNRFQLVLVSSKRARQIAMGKPPMVEWENDKATVVALREIAEGLVTNAILTQKEEVEEELVEVAADGEQAAAEAATDEAAPAEVAPTQKPSDEIVAATAETPVLKTEDD